MPSTELLQGTLDLLILKALALGPNHGVGVARRVQQLTNGTFEVGPGSLFPALHRLEEKGFVRSKMGGASQERGGRRKRLFSITAYGRNALEELRDTRNVIWKLITKVSAS